MESFKDEKYLRIIQVAVYVLKQQGEDDAGTMEGQNPWQALNAIKNEAEVWDVPLSEIGLEGYDIDAILNSKKK